MPSAIHRKKLSTTISSESYGYIERQIAAGRASSVAEVVDRALERMRRIENRSQLERDTAAYFNSFSPGFVCEDAVPRPPLSLSRLSTAGEDAELGAALGGILDEVDLDS